MGIFRKTKDSKHTLHPVLAEFRSAQLLSMRDALGFDLAGLVFGKPASSITIFFDIAASSQKWQQELVALEELDDGARVMVMQEFVDGDLHTVAITVPIVEKTDRKEPTRALARLAGWSVHLRELDDCTVQVIGADELERRLGSWCGAADEEFPGCVAADIRSDVAHIEVADQVVSVVECPLADLGDDDELEAVLRDLAVRDADFALCVITRPYTDDAGGRRTALVQLRGPDIDAVEDLVAGFFQVVDVRLRLRCRRVRGFVRLAWLSSLPVGVLVFSSLSPQVAADIRKVMM